MISSLGFSLFCFTGEQIAASRRCVFARRSLHFVASRWMKIDTFSFTAPAAPALSGIGHQPAYRLFG